MDFDFNINSLVGGKTIFIFDRLLKPAKVSVNLPSTQKHLCHVIDRLGEASAKAQGLSTVITTSSKLSYTDQRVYIYTECQSNSGKGTAVGFIKVGTKKLFLYDHQGNQREMEPLCILDFYVHERKQRQGFGKKLFEFMLENERVTPSHLAVDRPSDRFLAFLTKHYKLRVTIPQVNNYVIFEGFFTNRKDQSKKRGSRGGGDNAQSRAAHNPMAINDINLSHNSSMNSNSTSCPSPSEELASLSHIPLARPSSREKLVSMRNSPIAQSSYQNHSIAAHETGLPTAPSSNQYVANLPDSVTQLAVSNGTRSQSAQSRAFSRHSSASLPVRSDYQEPLRTRYGQPNVVSTVDRLNTHQYTQNKQGHLKVTSNTAQTNIQDQATDWSKNFHGSANLKQPPSSWNVFGVPPGYSHLANRKAC
ncbi:ATAT1 [Bugula neritina]|uniref:Alpha-tubulin N-acetyltransferase n=1 Tax=Bugula neritina TaxID=10212 RepID=A0A7J7K804_BUGNE|nr:ATAT1 [Bugula neritina]